MKVSPALVVLLVFGAPVATAQSSGQAKPILEMTQANWVTVDQYNGLDLVYFTHLESWRCAISSVRYSVNSEALDQVWRLQPCDPANPNAVTTDKPYASFPEGSVRSVAVQIVYSDGSQSQVARFSR